MSSSQPIVRQRNWFSVFPQVLVLVVICGIYYYLGVSGFIFFGAGTYLLLSFFLRRMSPINQRKGIVYLKKKQYQKALDEFKLSYEFFKSYNWIDKYRFVVLLSSSRISYTEMALANIAFCYGQLGEGAKSKEYYENILKEFPDSQIAIVSLKMFDAAKDMRE